MVILEDKRGIAIDPPEGPIAPEGKEIATSIDFCPFSIFPPVDFLVVLVSECGVSLGINRKAIMVSTRWLGFVLHIGVGFDVELFDVHVVVVVLSGKLLVVGDPHCASLNVASNLLHAIGCSRRLPVLLAGGGGGQVTCYRSDNGFHYSINYTVQQN